LKWNGQRIVAIKNLTMNESFFQGHFPGQPVMPGVLILESMAQAGGILLLQEIPDRDSKLMYLASMNNVKFRRPIVPGDQMRVEVNIAARKGDLCKIEGKAFVDGKLCTEANMMCVMLTAWTRKSQKNERRAADRRASSDIARSETWPGCAGGRIRRGGGESGVGRGMHTASSCECARPGKVRPSKYVS
jgi:3-hydroxyacyl-[acyl-carrier-protein] dehydratase